jgi:Tol biopolymer transport system component
LTTSQEGATKPAWSRTEKQLAFTRYVEEKSQIFILSMEGGEPVQLTTVKYGANNPKWSPDGKKNILIKYFITRTTKRFYFK